MKEAFIKMTGVADAWTNPALAMARNGFVAGWESALEQAAKVCEEVVAVYDDSVTCEECAKAIRGLK